MKKVLSIFLAVLMLMSMMSVAVFAAEPDGTKENPYPVAKPSAAPTSLTIEPGQTIYYRFPTLLFNGWTISGYGVTGIEVDGVLYDTVDKIDRCIKVTLDFAGGMGGGLVGFANSGEEAVEVYISYAEPVGTMDAPFALEDGENAVTIPNGYYEFYAAYLPTVNGEFEMTVSNIESFDVAVDLDGDLSTDSDRVYLAEKTLSFQAESYINVFVIVYPLNDLNELTITVTPPAKGIESNPYWLGSYEEILGGYDYAGDGMWPATTEGVYFTLDGGLAGTTLQVIGQGPINVTINGTNYTYENTNVGTLEIPLSLTEEEYSFAMKIESPAYVRLDIQFPEGNYNNPAELKNGKNHFSIAAGLDSYYATYVAEKDGILNVTASNMVNVGMIDASNQTTYEYDYLSNIIVEEGDEGLAEVDNVIVIPVTAGDVVFFGVYMACDESTDWEYLAADFDLVVRYEGDSLLEIVEQPKTATYAKNGATVKVTVKAEGDGLKYQWYIKNAGATKYTKSSVTKATYSTTMSDKANGRRLYCVITDANGNTVQTNTVLIRMQATITKESATANYAKKGATIKVSVSAVGDGLKYTWYVKNVSATKYSKSSVTSATYSVKMADKVKGRRVYCVVTDKYGKKVQSKTFLLRESVSIITQPKTTTTAKNKTAKITVKASGDGLKYTWYIKDAGSSKYTKSSVKTATYSVKMTSKVKNRVIYCVVTDKYGKTVKTTAVKLKMK